MLKKPNLVLFDMDNVLCHYDRHIRTSYFSTLAHVALDHVHYVMWTSGLEDKGDSGALAAMDYLQALSDGIGYQLSLDHWLAARKAAMSPDAEMLAIAARLRPSVEIAVLTNNSTLVTDHIDQLYPELPPLFGAHIYASARFKTAKPDPECYRRCLAELGYAPEQVLFIDDLEENVLGARQAGLAAHHHTSLATLEQALAAYGF